MFVPDDYESDCLQARKEETCLLLFEFILYGVMPMSLAALQ